MKTLVTFYSRSGNTKKIAEKIAKNLNADIDEIVDLKDRSRKIIGWIIAGKDASKKSLTEIEHKKDPSKYDLVIIGTPIWAWTMTPAIRTYLTNNNFKSVAFFCTCGGNERKAFEEMEELSKKPVAVLKLEEKSVKKDQFEKDLNNFCKNLI